MARSDTDKIEKALSKQIRKLSPEAASAVAFRSALRVQSLGFHIAPPSVTINTAGPILWSLLTACCGAIQRGKALEPILEILNEGALMIHAMKLTLSIKDMEGIEGIGQIAQLSLVGCTGNALATAGAAAQTASMSAKPDRASNVVSSTGVAAQAGVMAMLGKDAEDQQDKVVNAIVVGESVQKAFLEAARVDVEMLLPSKGFFWSAKGAGKQPMDVIRSPLWQTEIPGPVIQSHERFVSVLDEGGLKVVADWYRRQMGGWLNNESKELHWVGLSEAFWAQPPHQLGAALEEELKK